MVTVFSTGLPSSVAGIILCPCTALRQASSRRGKSEQVCIDSFEMRPSTDTVICTTQRPSSLARLDASGYYSSPIFNGCFGSILIGVPGFGAAATATGGGGACTRLTSVIALVSACGSLDVDEFRRRNVGLDFFELGRRRRRLVDVLGFFDLGNFHRRNNLLDELSGQPGIKSPYDDNVQKDDGDERRAPSARK